MIAHLSVPAQAPREAALALAELINGTVLPFPVVNGASIVIACDGSGFAIELIPEHMAHHPGEGEALPVPAGLQAMPWEVQIRADGATPGAGPFHIALHSPLDAEVIGDIARAHGWRCVECDRGGVFKVVEFWLENRFLIEVLTPHESARYRTFMQPDTARAMFEAAA